MNFGVISCENIEEIEGKIVSEGHIKAVLHLLRSLSL